MRTDSFRVAKEAQERTRNYIKDKFGPEFLPPIPRKYKSRKTAQGAHEAVRPTSMKRSPEKIKAYLSEDQLKLYTLIWNRFIASQMASARLVVTTVLVAADGAIFKATGTQVLFPGFLAVYKEEKEEEKEEILPGLNKGQQLVLISLNPQQHFTKSPPPYTEATLVKVLEEKGIGRPSTYAPIIYTVIKRNYVTKESGKLHPTDLGKIVIQILIECFPDIINVEFTAKMEENLDEVEREKISWTEVLEEFYRPFLKDLEKAHEELKKISIKPVVTKHRCSRCGKPLVIRFGRYGKFLACSDFPKCRHTEPLITDVPCPELGCDGVLVERRSRKGRKFYACNKYPKCKFTVSSLRRLIANRDSETTQEEE